MRFSVFCLQDTEQLAWSAVSIFKSFVWQNSTLLVIQDSGQVSGSYRVLFICLSVCKIPNTCKYQPSCTTGRNFVFLIEPLGDEWLTGSYSRRENKTMMKIDNCDYSICFHQICGLLNRVNAYNLAWWNNFLLFVSILHNLSVWCPRHLALISIFIHIKLGGHHC